MSVDRSPRLRNCNSLGTALLIPTPSSALSHMEGLLWRKNWSEGVLEYGVLGALIRSEPITPSLQHSITPFYKQVFFTQSTISHLLANQTSGNDLAYFIASS